MLIIEIYILMLEDVYIEILKGIKIVWEIVDCFSIGLTVRFVYKSY